MIVVSDNQDIYLYRSDSGKGSAIHENIFDDLSIKTLAFSMDNPARKGYFTSDNGHFKIVNI